jgi:hypothetical protein
LTLKLFRWVDDDCKSGTGGEEARGESESERGVVSERRR